MMRTRASIKGIGSSIFYDVEEPVFNPKSSVAEIGTGFSGRTGRLSEIQKEPAYAQRDVYDTGDLISLWERQTKAYGNSSFENVSTLEDQEAMEPADDASAGKTEGIEFDAASSEDHPSENSRVSGKKTFAIEFPFGAKGGRARPPGKTETADFDTPSLEDSDDWGAGLDTKLAPSGIEVPPSASSSIAYEPPADLEGAPASENSEPGLDRNSRLTGTQPVDLGEPLGDLKTESPEQEQRAWKRLGDQAFENMLQEIGILYSKTVESLSTHAEVAKRSMDLLSEARDLLLMGNAGDFNLAERRVNEVKLNLKRIEQTRRWANTYGWGLFAYELVLFGGLVILLLFDQHIAEWISLMTGTYSVTNGVAQLTQSMSLIFPPWNTMLWGGIGGVVGALYSLHWHVSELQDFDKQYSLWYVVQPMMGLILGGIVHLVIVTGLLALIPVSGSSVEPSVALQWFPALVACLAGFRQKFTYELLDAIMKALGRQPTGLVKA